MHSEDATARAVGARASAQAHARALRHARNQLWSRRLNDQIARLQYSSAFDEYVCECGSKKCVAPISLSAEEYEQIRNEPWHFVVHPGHWSRKYERVVNDESRYQVIEKLAALEELMRRLAARPLDEPR